MHALASMAIMAQYVPLPLDTDYERDMPLFWIVTAIAVAWWLYHFIRLPGTINELRLRFNDLGTGQSILPLFMQLIFTTVWWLLPLGLIALVWNIGYGRYFFYLTR